MRCFQVLEADRKEEVWNEKLGIYEYVAGDNSLLILLYGIATIFIIIAYIIVAVSAVKSSYKLELLKEKGKHINTFAEDVKSLFNENLHKSPLHFQYQVCLYSQYFRLFS